MTDENSLEPTQQCPETAAHGVHACTLLVGHDGDHLWDFERDDPWHSNDDSQAPPGWYDGDAVGISGPRWRRDEVSVNSVVEAWVVWRREHIAQTLQEQLRAELDADPEAAGRILQAIADICPVCWGQLSMGEHSDGCIVLRLGHERDAALVRVRSVLADMESSTEYLREHGGGVYRGKLEDWIRTLSPTLAEQTPDGETP